MIKTLTKSLHSLLELFYPKLCASCNSHLTPSEDTICIFCEEELARSHFLAYADNPIEKLFYGRVKLSAAGSLYYFDKHAGIRNMMHLLKYKQRRDIGHWMGKKLGEELLRSKRFQGIDYIIPIPLHPKKKFIRGYNQSEEIARGIEEVTAWPLLNSLQRREHTESQTRKSKFDRWLNVESAFQCSNPHRLKDKSLLLVDDVITTGATIEAAAQVLLNATSAKVNIVSVASA